MNKDTFSATIIMMGWTKEGEYQYSKYIRNRLILLLCRDSGAIVINNTKHTVSNKSIDYDILIELVRNDFTI